MSNLTQTAIERYLSVFDAASYKVQLKNRLTDEGFWVDYTPDQLAKSETVRYLRDKNSKGFDIYARPIGYQYVLLDDLSFDSLSELARLKPCLLIETSPTNYQAWLILPTIPANRDIAKVSCQTLAIQLGADLASAEPDHVGRLPGFTNRKEKYRLQSGLFPFVRLCRAANRLSTFYPCGGAVLNKNTTAINSMPLYQHSPSKNSSSEQDFGVACGLIRAGKTDIEISQHLERTSPDLAVRKGKYLESYLQRTIANAHKAIQSII
ncbi:DNA-primase RepB domain-containing protein [Spirosoma endbachense]|uniref:Uncharacterized protein n=1 Tax=Spirosoma endbachense TaxID=2666025 RepID=A0A6P1W2R8_9BACT|nr:DNA-primase RepB domain-containing protein [Spirosoma endbachense]QHV98280.1 hypothetical protein GJR95_26225 [Spirosoma endbachense]